MTDWFTAVIYFYSESENKRYKTEINEQELAYILRYCGDLNQLAEFLSVINKTMEVKE